MGNRSIIRLPLALSMVLLLPAASKAGEEVRETKLGEVDLDGWDRKSVRFDPAFLHIGYLTKDGRAVVDGKSYGPYDEVVEPPVFSADGCSWFFTARDSGRQILVVDGKTFDAEKVIDAKFSPDGSRFGAVLQRAKGRCVLLVDGKEAAVHDSITEVAFGPKGRRMAYAAEEKGRAFVTVDGKRHPDFDRTMKIHFSPEGSRIAYGAAAGDVRHLVVDGKAEPPVMRIVFQPVHFSADGKRIAYGHVKGSAPDFEWYVTVDRETFGPWDGLGLDGFVFSPDGKRFAFSVSKGGDWYVILNGEQGLRFDSITKGTPVFSPDGKRVAYCGVRRGDCWIWIDGELMRNKFEDVGGKFFRFSPDSSRFDFCAQKKGMWAYYVGGMKHPGFNMVFEPFYNPADDRIAYVGKTGRFWALVVDGKEVNRFDLIHNCRLYWTPDGKDLVCAICLGHDWFFLAGGKKVGPYDEIPYDPIGRYAFLQDGMLRFFARRGRTLMRVEASLK